MIEHLFALEFSQFALDLGVLVQPGAERQIDDIKFVIHLTGRNCEEQKLLVEDKRRALLSNEIVVY